MAFDPTLLGSLCDRCVLQGCDPVPPERSRRSTPIAILVGEAPGEKEVEASRPFVGPAGHELQRAISSVGLRRADCHITNAVLCLKGASSRSIERAEREATKRNKTIEEGKDPWLSPIDACRPRLLAEIREFEPASVISLGGIAYRALTGRREKPMEVRGGPRNEPFGRLLPTLHPSFVMRTRRWTHAFTSDLSRAVRWFTTGLEWKDPETIYRPTPIGLRAWLDREAGSPFVVYDVETAPGFVIGDAERYDPMYDRLRCVGLGSHDGQQAIVVPFRSKEDPARLFYSLDEYRELISIFRDFFASERWRKVGHNAGYYDRMVIESHFGVMPAPILDTLGLHKFVEPELPHSLGYVGSIYTDVDSWKQGHVAENAETDQELWAYNSKDVAVTALSVAPLAKAVADRNQTAQAAWFPFLQGLCVDLHKTGMYVDQAKRREWDTKLLADARRLKREILDSVGRDFNPGSFKQVANLLFDDWNLMPVDYTDMGDPSTGDDSLREILAKQNLNDKQRRVISSIRMYRRRTKYRGTYTLKFRPMREAGIEENLSWDEEETFEERERRYKKEIKKLGIVLDDGRVHGDWNPHGTLGWRLSSSNPNLMNVPNKLRDIFSEEPGWCLVGCDQAQLELRMSAALAHSAAYLEAFDARRDPHAEFCRDIFRDEYDKAEGDHKKALRRTIKELTYACLIRGTKVVTLGPEGSKPIEAISPGVDWTWSWDGSKYSPSRIIEKRCNGRKPCVRVTFEWSSGRSGIRRAFVICTKDHPFMLRDGSYREAGMLRSGDSLMPFYRWTNKEGYRIVCPKNDSVPEKEHRAVSGLSREDPRVVHHADEVKSNNNPSNLEVIDTAGDHSRIHWDDPKRMESQREINARLWSSENRDVMNAKLTAGRLASEEWRSANAENYRRMRAGLEKARAEGRGTTKGQRRSKLSAFDDKIGVLPDADIAKMAGVTKQAVMYYRKTRGIPYPRGGNHTVVSVDAIDYEYEVWDIEVDHPAHNFAIDSGVFVHNSQFRAEVETVHSVLTSAEDENEELLYPSNIMTVSKVGAMHRRWLARAKFDRWWEETDATYARQGYLLDPVLGLRCDFLDGPDDKQLGNKLVNFLCQSGGAAIVHLATKRFIENMPKEWRELGVALVNQCHDSLTARVPKIDGLPEKVGKFLEECFTFKRGEIPGLDVEFIGEMKVGNTWKEV
jgi:uracil-DNA glycosylase family 4